MLPDEDEFRSFYETHFDAVYRYFGRRTAGADVADLVSDVFLVAWRRFPEMPTSSHERTLWLYGVARRVLADGRKAQRRRARLVVRMQAAADGQVSTPVDIDSSDLLDDRGRLSSALSQLAPRDSEVLTLVAWEQLTHVEAAEVLDCTVNAFTIRLHRARKRLAVAYGATPGQEAVPFSVREPSSVRETDSPQGASDARP